jgi:methylenetetrahydrofolate reductase (NADPH)
MRIAELYRRKRPVFSFEFFPPRTDAGVDSLFRALEELALLNPDFVSVTCPLDKPRRPLTFELVARIQRELDLTAMAHLVTVLYARDEVRRCLEQLRSDGVENLLALRGDLPPDAGATRCATSARVRPGRLRARVRGFSIGGAAHPEMHPDSRDWVGDIAGARSKVRAGCEFLDHPAVLRQRRLLRLRRSRLPRAAGLEVPVVAGIMPVRASPGVRRMCAMNRQPDPRRARARARARRRRRRSGWSGRWGVVGNRAVRGAARARCSRASTSSR